MNSGSERVIGWIESSWQFESLLWGISSGFLWTIILISLVHSVHLVHLWILPCMHNMFYPKWLLSKRSVSSLALVNITPSDLQRVFLPMCGPGLLLTLRNMRNMRSGQGSTSSLNYPAIQCWRIDCFELWCWRRLFRVPWAARRSNQSILK